MTQYIVRRILRAIPLLILISIASFALIQAAPGGPLAMYRAPNLKAEDVERIEEKLGLNDPLHVQYVKWLGNVLRGDLGNSFVTHRPVVREIGDRILNTVYLMSVTFIVIVLISVPVGVISALKQYSIFDIFVTTFAFIGQSLPTFWVGLILILIFFSGLENPFTGGPLLPAGGMKTVGASFSLTDRLRHLVLPVTMLSMTWVAWYTRYLRSSMLEVIHQDYIRTARSKGLPERIVLFRHALKNAAIPLVTLVAMDLPYLFTGALYTEIIFSWPGMGRLYYASASRRDYPVLMAVIMISSTLIVVSNLLADIAYAYLDPRIRYN
jgi:peptide/nickel transport system permease protein